MKNKAKTRLTKSQANKSFTFVETLVVITVLGFILPVIFTILFVILQQQLRIFRVTEVKRVGDHIASVLETVIKNNAYTIYDDGGVEICEADPTNPFPHSGLPDSFRDKYRSAFLLSYASPNISVVYPVPNPPAPTFAFAQGQLNSSKVNVSTFSISCNRASTYSAPVISINFTVCYRIGAGCVSSRPEEMASFDYQTTIILKNYPTL